jgi:hypothetical protein
VQGEVVGQLGAGGGEDVGQDPGHGEHRRAGVDAEALGLPEPAPASRDVLLLEDDDLVPRAGQVARGRQPAEPCTHHSHLHPAMLPEHRRLRNVGTVANMIRRIVVSALGALFAWLAVSVAMAGPAAANHSSDADEMWVTVAINAAGADRVSVTDENFVSERRWEGVASEAAVAIGRPEGSFEAFDDIDSAYAELDDKLARTDDRGALSWAFDTGNLQLLAQREGYDVLLFEVCTPRVRQVVSTLMAPQPSDFDSPGSRCRGWFQPVDEPAIRGSVQLTPDRNRYSSAMNRTIAAAVNTLVVLGIGAFLLRRGPLKRRSVGSWLVALGAAFGVSLFGWGLVTFTLWWTAAPADSVMLGEGSEGEQVARTMLPGLIFVLPALVPALLLLTVPRKERVVAPIRPMGPPPGAWGPGGPWQQWGGQSGPPPGPWGSAPAPPGPPPYGAPAGPYGSPPPPYGAPAPPSYGPAPSYGSPSYGAPGPTYDAPAAPVSGWPPTDAPPPDPPPSGGSPDAPPPPGDSSGWAVPGSGPHG